MQRFTITFAVALFVGLVSANTATTAQEAPAAAKSGYAEYAKAY
jgi:hypothetical protein